MCVCHKDCSCEEDELISQLAFLPINSRLDDDYEDCGVVQFYSCQNDNVLWFRKELFKKTISQHRSKKILIGKREPRDVTAEEQVWYYCQHFDTTIYVYVY